MHCEARNIILASNSVYGIFLVHVVNNTKLGVQSASHKGLIFVWSISPFIGGLVWAQTATEDHTKRA